MARSSISPDIGGHGGEAVVYTFTVCEAESCSKMQKTEAKLSPHNKLNELTGREWIKFTKSWFSHSPERRADANILHPPSLSESLATHFLLFFTKRGATVR